MEAINIFDFGVACINISVTFFNLHAHPWYQCPKGRSAETNQDLWVILDGLLWHVNHVVKDNNLHPMKCWSDSCERFVAECFAFKSLRPLHNAGMSYLLSY